MRRLLAGFFLLCFFFAAVFVHAQEEYLNDINDELANEELADAENDEDVDAIKELLTERRKTKGKPRGIKQCAAS
jgi:hypothetical protein